MSAVETLSLRLSETRTLWFAFVATLVCFAAFQIIVAQYGVILLDGISNPVDARAAIAAMSDSQRCVHSWVTGVLDVAFPAAYGALFVGSACKFFPKIARLLVWPIVLLVAVDLVEGVVQILGLTGAADWLGAKAFLTPFKLVLFYFGLVMTFCGWIAWLVGRFKSGTSAE